MTAFTIHDLGGIDDIELLIELTGANQNGEQFKLYVSLDIRHQPAGGTLRLEDEKGSGYDVGRVHMSCSSFSRPSLVLDTFNSCPVLTGRLLMLAADRKQAQDLRWERKKAAHLAAQTA